MLRKLPLATAVALALMPFQSQALGLGSITTSSVLNEEFDGEIKLLSVAPGELDTVKVRLASSKDFERLGIEKPYVLSRLKFEPQRKDNGEAVVRVTSQELIQEPFLNFLVEVNWPKGRMLREFTVLLDPPLTTGRKVRPVSAPVTSSSAAASASSGASSARSQRTNQAAASGEYGPVARNETLWTIAERFSGGGISVHQMMQAMLQANPRAFTDNNINTLKAGSVLRIPTREEAMALTRRQAANLSDQHYKQWKQGIAASKTIVPEEPAPVKAKPVEKAPAPEVSVEPPPAAEEKAAEVKPDDKTPAGMEEAEQARLELSGTEAAANGSGADTDDTAIKDELITAQEKVVSSQGEVQDMMSRMSLMERQVADMQRLLELKDDQLSQLQTANETLTSETQAAREEAAEAKAQQEAVQSQVALKPADPKPAQAVAVKPAAPQTEMDKVKSLVDLVTGSAMLMGIMIAVLVVLLALVWAAFSRRKPADDDAALAPVAAPAAAVAAGAVAAAAVPAETAADEHPEEETSFLKEFASGGMDSFQDLETGESDPIAEADVYIAYGRYDQAETMINQALEASPDDRALQNKLLEIYYANKEQERFSQLAEQMHNSGAEEQDPDAWNRIKLMGADIDPENQLFVDAMDAPSLDLNDDLDLSGDLDTALSELESEMSKDPELSSMLPDADTPDDQEADETPADDGIVALSEEEPSAEIDSLEDAFALPEEDLPGSDEIAELAVEDTSLDDLAAELESFDLDALEIDSGPAADNAAEHPEAEVVLDDEDFILGDGFDELSSEIAGMDDVATKLDLAKAYVEMGDSEGAKSILEEVVSEGDATQQQQAKELLDGMS